MLWWSVPLTRRQWHSGSCDVRGFTCCILLGAAASRYNSTVCPTRYRTRHFFNKFTTNEQLGTLQPHATDTSLFISHTTNVFLFKFRCNIFIGVRIIKEMPGSVASGTHCILQLFHCWLLVSTSGAIIRLIVTKKIIILLHIVQTSFFCNTCRNTLSFFL